MCFCTSTSWSTSWLSATRHAMDLLRFLPSYWVPQPLVSSDDLKQQLVQRPRPLGSVSTTQPGLYFCPVFVSGNLLQYLPLKSGYSECGIISMQLLDTTLSLESKSVSTWSSVADHQPLACNPSSSSCPPASSSPAPAKNFPGQELGKPAESEYQTGPTLEPELVD